MDLTGTQRPKNIKISEFFPFSNHAKIFKIPSFQNCRHSLRYLCPTCFRTPAPSWWRLSGRPGQARQAACQPMPCQAQAAGQAMLTGHAYRPCQSYRSCLQAMPVGMGRGPRAQGPGPRAQGPGPWARGPGPSWSMARANFVPAADPKRQTQTPNSQQ